MGSHIMGYSLVSEYARTDPFTEYTKTLICLEAIPNIRPEAAAGRSNFRFHDEAYESRSTFTKDVDGDLGYDVSCWLTGKWQSKLQGILLEPYQFFPVQIRVQPGQKQRTHVCLS